jgi:cytochrome c peroxidase
VTPWRLAANTSHFSGFCLLAISFVTTPYGLRPADPAAFKTPTLREVSRTAPYMHDGSFPKIETVIDFYSGGGRNNPYLDAQIEPRKFSLEEKFAIAAFLRSLPANERRSLSV